MKKNRFGPLSLAFCGSFLVARLLAAQSVTTDPVGFTTATLLGNSDSFVSLPFVRPAEFVGAIQSAAGSNIAVNGNPWAANQFVYNGSAQPNHYYVLIGPASAANPREGRTYPIISNNSNTLTVDLGGDNLVGIPANARLSVIPNWTLATAFPATDQNISFTPTTSTAQYKTQIRVPNVSAPGINLPYITYFFSNNVDGTSGNVGWRLVGDNTTDHGNDALLPDSYFVVRNQNGAPTLPLVSLGGVLLDKLTVPLLTGVGSAQQDNPVSMLRPLDVTLNATGLNLADGSFAATDQLLVYNNVIAGFDKSPSAIYVQSPSAVRGPWRLNGDTVTDRGGDVIPAGSGFVIRKGGTKSGQTAYWTNSFPVSAVSAVSRKTHGSAGDFDVDLPLTGTPAVECRGTGGSHKIIFTFAGAVTFSGASVTSGIAGSATALASGSNQVTVNLTGVADAQRITVTLLDVNDGANKNDVAIRMGLLAGDTNGNGSVTGTDVSQTKSGAQTGAVTAANFRQDVNLNGIINASDIGQVKSNSGHLLPAP